MFYFNEDLPSKSFDLNEETESKLMGPILDDVSSSPAVLLQTSEQLCRWLNLIKDIKSDNIKGKILKLDLIDDYIEVKVSDIDKKVFVNNHNNIYNLFISVDDVVKLESETVSKDLIMSEGIYINSRSCFLM